MKVLQLCNKPPFPPVDGGTMAMNSITQGLLQAECQVRVLSMSSDKHPVRAEGMTEEYLRATQFDSVPIDLSLHPFAAAVSMLCGDSYHVRRFQSRAFAGRLAQVLKEEQFDIVHMESIFMAPYVPVVRKYSRAPLILRTHNVENQIWRQMARGERNYCKRRYIKYLAMTLAAYEHEHINDFDGVVSITDTDAEYFRAVGCRKPIITIPFAMEPAIADNEEEEAGSLFHLGSMDWLPNQEGVRWFIDRVWPMVHRTMPGLTFYLAGRKMPADLLSAQIEGVNVVGEVVDAARFISSKQINVVPLLSGSGIRVKIIESMSLGKVVISTSLGARGIDFTDGQNILIADTPEDFVKQVGRCVTDTTFRRTIGCNARQFVADTYNIQTLTGRLIEFYEKRINLQ